MRLVVLRMLAVLCGVVLSSALLTNPQAAALNVKTSVKEAKRVDRVAKPKIKWAWCGKNLQCGYAGVPLDYDAPKGAKVQLYLARYRDPKQRQRIGTLFVNPGGPGYSGVDLAKVAKKYFSAAILERFDIVGFDPRGTGRSGNVKCFSNDSLAYSQTSGMNVDFPDSANERSKYLAATRKLAQACSKQKIASAMSTAEVARDMDVLRRAVGDSKLNFYGASYGTYLGQVYAALFPTRVRTLLLDGVLDPYKWRGNSAATPVTLRIGAAQAAQRALQVGMEQCRLAGDQYCPIMPDPMAAYDRVAKLVRANPIGYHPDVQQTGKKFTYADYVAMSAQYLNDEDGPEKVANMVADLLALYESRPRPEKPAGHVGRAATQQRLGIVPSLSPYTTSDNAYYAVMCSDARNPNEPSAWAAAIKKTNAGYFADYWGWASAPCATKYWKARDTDRYEGKFETKTATPALLLANYYDPATSFASARSVNGLLRGSKLVASASFGHTSYGGSKCVQAVADSYLITRRLPTSPPVCPAELQLFSKSIQSEDSQ